MLVAVNVGVFCLVLPFAFDTFYLINSSFLYSNFVWLTWGYYVTIRLTIFSGSKCFCVAKPKMLL